MQKKTKSGAMNSEKFTSVWDPIEVTPEESENLKLRSSLIIALKAYLNKSGLTQVQSAKLFCVTASRVSDLMRGKINLF